MAISLRPAQEQALEELKNGSVLIGSVGTGKSRVSLAYYYLKVCRGRLKVNGVGDVGAMRTPRNLLIVTTALKRDRQEWDKELSDFGLSRNPETSFGGVEVIVESWNNLHKHTDLEDWFIIFDENRVVGTGEWSKNFLKLSRKNKWIVLSATPADVWMDYIPVFIANGFYRNKSEFLDRHVVYDSWAKYPKVKKYLNVELLKEYEDRITVPMPVEKHTVRHEKEVLCEYDRELFDRVVKKRWNVFEECPVQNVAEMIRVARKVVNSDESRLKGLDSLLVDHPRLIIFYNFNYELEMLRGWVSEKEDVLVSEWNGHRHEKIPEGKSWVYLVQYAAGAEGWNCVETDTLVFFSLNYSWRQMEQARGRIDRMNTDFTDLWYFTLRSKSMIDAIILRSLRSKRNFNERLFEKELDKL